VAFSLQAKYTDWVITVASEVVPTFWGGLRVLSDQHNKSLWPLISVFWTRAVTLSFSQLLNYPLEAEWTPFQINYF
jgi:hypothetical protein